MRSCLQDHNDSTPGGKGKVANLDANAMNFLGATRVLDSVHRNTNITQTVGNRQDSSAKH